MRVHVILFTLLAISASVKAQFGDVAVDAGVQETLDASIKEVDLDASSSKMSADARVSDAMVADAWFADGGGVETASAANDKPAPDDREDLAFPDGGLDVQEANDDASSEVALVTDISSDVVDTSDAGVAQADSSDDAAMPHSARNMSELDSEDRGFFPTLPDWTTPEVEYLDWFRGDSDEEKSTESGDTLGGRSVPRIERSAVPSFVLAFFLLTLTFAIALLRKSVTGQGFLARLLGLIDVVLRVMIVVLLVVGFLRLLPSDSVEATAVLKFISLGLAIAAGLALRDFIADLWARVIISFEHRFTNDMWIAGEAFAGSIQEIGLRATTLRDAQGHLIAVPNRDLVASTVVSDVSGNRLAQVSIRLDQYELANTRSVLRDAVLGSPWIMPGTEVVVLRDPDDPHLWHVQANLLDSRYMQRFRGELVERVESVIAVPGSVHDFIP